MTETRVHRFYVDGKLVASVRGAEAKVISMTDEELRLERCSLAEAVRRESRLRKAPSKEWLLRMAEADDGKCTSVGGLAVELGLYKKEVTPDNAG